MSLSIRILEGTSIADVLSWTFSASTELRISESADFLPGAQGVALSALSSFVRQEAELVVRFEFAQPRTEAELSNSLVSTPFGYSLARLAKKIYFGKIETSASPDFKELLARHYKASNGRFVYGQQAGSILAIDPHFRVPPFFPGDVDLHFPTPSTLQRALVDIAGDLGFKIILQSETEQPIVRFAYEVFRNSIEHGVHGWAPSGGEPLRAAFRSTRAILLEKISGRALHPNSKIVDSPTRQYLQRVSEDHRAAIGASVLCLTIADQGDGIQSTLPEIEGETPLDRLSRAFREGESRKPKGEVERGKGLPAALNSSFDLGVMIKVFSAGIAFSQDFSLGDQEYPGLKLNDENSSKTICRTGTCISIYIPEFRVSPDQRSLLAVGGRAGV